MRKTESWGRSQNHTVGQLRLYGVRLYYTDRRIYYQGDFPAPSDGVRKTPRPSSSNLQHPGRQSAPNRQSAPKVPNVLSTHDLLSHTRCPKSERLGGCTRGNDPAPRRSPAQILPYPRMKRTPPQPLGLYVGAHSRHFAPQPAFLESALPSATQPYHSVAEP